MNNKRDKSDRLFDALVYRAIVPKGFRPQNNEQIEEMLDALGSEELSSEKLQRMLGKIHGQIPMTWETEDSDPTENLTDSAETHELVEMFRARGEELPPELEEKLREMEKRAAKHPNEEENSNDG
tara:strand:- start:3069 stop:3443 length:375 start_codon:yes stop_codon:yes gene_type:complete